MADKAIVAVDDLGTAVAEWRSLDKDALLDIGDRLNDVHQRLQLVIGAWLYIYDDLGYGAIKSLAERWDRKPNTLSQWKSVYKRTRNLYTHTDLPFSKLQHIARIPAEHQEAWLDTAKEMNTAKLGKAITAAKDWQPPVIIESADTISETAPKSQVQYRRLIGRLYWRKFTSN